jgi:peroxin-3
MDGLRARVFVDTAASANVPNSAQEVVGEAQAPSGTGESDKTSEKEKVKIRLAGLLPGLARWCQLELGAQRNAERVGRCES